MKILVLLLLAAFIIAVHRRARTAFVAAYLVATYVLFCAMLTGCSHTPPPRALKASDLVGLWVGNCPANSYLRGDGTCFVPPPEPLTCADLPPDGSYLIIGCGNL